MIGILIMLNPAVGRSQWAVDSEYRFGFATAVAGPTLSSGSILNPALMQGSSFSVSISDEFGLSELRSAYIIYVMSRKKHSYSLQVGSFGYSLYREWHAAGSLAYRLSHSKVGLSILTDRISVPGYGHGMAITTRFGSQLSLSETLFFGVVGDRILIQRFGRIRTHIPTSWIAALNWHWIPQASVSFGVQSEVGNPPTGSVSVRWNPIESLTLSIAHEPVTQRWAAGVRIRFGRWNVPFAGTYHNELGWSRHMGAGWNKGEE